MRSDSLLVLNAGSSSLKLGMFLIEGTKPIAIGRAYIDLRAKPLVIEIVRNAVKSEVAMTSRVTENLHDVVAETLEEVAKHFDVADVKAVGHRVVHGGEQFSGPVRLTLQAIADIEALTPLAPLHQPPALQFIKAVSHLRPDLSQTASFDTAFHATQSDLVRRFAIPREFHDEGIKRYGFHGLSYKFVAHELGSRGIWPGRTIIAHLGSGASICGLRDGVSLDCSMGFSTLDGIPMATRPGALDPGVLLHLANVKKIPAHAIEDILYHRSGLLGVSGISADARDLLADTRVEAAQAIDLFCLRIAGEIGRICATLKGLDTLVFTAGIGEHQADIRSRIAHRLDWLGVELDEYQNARNAEKISDHKSRVHAYVIPTNEEQVIANEALSVLQ